jgi:hypothetical protein
MLDALQDLLHLVERLWRWALSRGHGAGRMMALALGLVKGAEYEPTYPGAEGTRREAWWMYSALASHSWSSSIVELKRLAW